MKRTLLIILASIAVIFIYGSCGLFKATSKNKLSDYTKTESNTDVKKTVDDVKVTEAKGVSENTSTVTSEDITYRKGNPNPTPIELTATFRLDTASTLKGDTALKLVDINNNGVSVVIYQDKKRNELTAKITSNGKSQNIPFEELRIKKNYSNTSSKIDTSKKDSSNYKLTLDSAGKGKSEDKHVVLDKKSEPTSKGMWAVIAIVAVLAIVGAVLYFIKNPRINK
jgi:hypothetical protein